MALATRSPRRPTGRRWLAVGIVVTILVLFVDASVRSRSPGPTRQLTASVWVDRVIPLVAASAVQGRELDAFFSDTSPTSGAAVRLGLDDLRSGAASTLRRVESLRAPSDLGDAAGLLDSCLMVRSREAAAITSAVVSALSAPIGVGAITRASRVLATAVTRLEVADEACSLFAGTLPGWLHLHMPVTAWVPAVTAGGSTGTSGSSASPGSSSASGSSGAAGGSTSAAAESAFLTALHRRVSLKTVSAVTVEAISTTPAAVSTRNGVQILSPDHHLEVAVVIGNTGNQTLDNLTVTASISPAAGASKASGTVSALDPGSSYALTVGALDPPIGKQVTLTVTVTPAPGSTAKSRSTGFTFEMPSPNSSVPTSTSTSTSTSSSSTSTSTSSSASSSSSTVAPGSSGSTATTSTTTGSVGTTTSPTT